MKRRIFLAILFSLCLLTACRSAEEEKPEPQQPPAQTEQTPAPEQPTQALPEPTAEFEPILLPEDSTSFSAAFAQQALTLCTGHTKDGEAKVLEENGFTVLEQVHYDKDPEEPAHNSAFTIAEREVERGGRPRKLLIVAVRGTDGAGEWASNFDVTPSRDFDSPYAENFDFCARDILGTLEPYLTDDPLVLVCGHSRGAACANLLGLLLQDEVPEQDLFVYTFATPNTVRGDAPDGRNIFNVINPNDLVTVLPLREWGFRRAGTDILLGGDEALTAQLAAMSAVMAAVSPDLEHYYSDRHSLTGPGLDEEHGVLLPDLMTALMGGSGDLSALSGNVSPDSDLAPLLGLFGQLLSDPWVMQQHMPMIYQLRLTVWAAQQ